MRLTSLAFALLLAGGLYYWFAMRGPAGDIEQQPVATAATAPTETVAQQNQTVPVMVIDSQARPTVDQLVLRGRTVAARNVSVPAETAGLVISQPIRKGTNVTEGDVLCKLDPGARAAQLLEVEAGLAEALVEAEAATTLSQKGFASETTRTARQAGWTLSGWISPGW
jgi:multidrug efflux system membrane fusion protein